MLIGNLDGCYSRRRICLCLTSDRIWQGQKSHFVISSDWLDLFERRKSVPMFRNQWHCMLYVLALKNSFVQLSLLNTGNGLNQLDCQCLALGSINIFTLLTEKYCCCSFSDKCTYFNSLWMKGSAKCPECKCKCKLWSCSARMILTAKCGCSMRIVSQVYQPLPFSECHVSESTTNLSGLKIICSIIKQ